MVIVEQYNVLVAEHKVEVPGRTGHTIATGPHIHSCTAISHLKEGNLITDM